MEGVLGSFDSLNPFIVKGLVAQGIRSPFVSGSNVISGYVVESLMARGYDEPFTLYGLLARTVETDDARSYVTFTLDPAARFSDGQPVTPQDVLFSWQLLRDHGRPNHRLYYGKVASAEIVGERAIRFDLAGSNDRELPLILGLMPVLPKHAINPETFEESSLDAADRERTLCGRQGRAGQERDARAQPRLLGARACRSIAASGISTRSGSIITATPIPITKPSRRGCSICAPRPIRGAGRRPTTFRRRATAASSRRRCGSGLPKASSFYVFNTRRPVFADIRVREAIALLFDFEWINHNLYFDLYQRSGSYFEGSELSARGRPADAAERALLAPFPDAVRPDVLDGTWSPPVSDGSGRDRTTLRRALDLLHRGRLRAARRRIGRGAHRQPAHLRDHDRDQARYPG